VGGRLDPVVALKPAAIAGTGQQALDGGIAVLVLQHEQVLAHQFRLARVHQRVALHIVDEEITVVAKAQG
jgi:hypothetical protein